MRTANIPEPTATERISLGSKISEAWVLTEISDEIINGSATPSVTYNIGFSTTFGGALTNIFASNRTVTTGGSTTTFATGTIPAGAYIYLFTTASSGTIPMLVITIKHM